MANCKATVCLGKENICKNCIKADVCKVVEEFKKEPVDGMYIEGCEHFKDRTRFVELPCRTGDNIFHIGEYINEIRIKSIHHFRIYKDGVYLFSDPWDGEICQSHQVGKIVEEEYDWNGYFLTREAAEQALKERENNV